MPTKIDVMLDSLTFKHEKSFWLVLKCIHNLQKKNIQSKQQQKTKIRKKKIQKKPKIFMKVE